LAARIRLLELGGAYQFFRAACLTSEEARSVDAAGLIEKADLLAINLDEAAAFLGMDPVGLGPEEAVDRVLGKIGRSQPDLQLSLTAGSRGSWYWDGSRLEHCLAFRVKAVSTAGAGDAHLAGLLAGLSAGLPSGQAGQLAGLVAALSVTSPDTIHPGLTCATLLDFDAENCFDLDPQVRACLAQG
jgi:sugar/nucleoside kinase (ribokinase family)